MIHVPRIVLSPWIACLVMVAVFTGLAGCGQSGSGVVDLRSEGSFRRHVVKNSRPAVVEIWDESMPECRECNALVEKLAKEFSGHATFSRLDLKRSPVLGGVMGVHAGCNLPAVRIYQQNRLVVVFDRRAPTEDELRQALARAIADPDLPPLDPVPDFKYQWSDGRFRTVEEQRQQQQ